MEPNGSRTSPRSKSILFTTARSPVPTDHRAGCRGLNARPCTHPWPIQRVPPRPLRTQWFLRTGRRVHRIGAHGTHLVLPNSEAVISLVATTRAECPPAPCAACGSVIIEAVPPHTLQMWRLLGDRVPYTSCQHISSCATAGGHGGLPCHRNDPSRVPALVPRVAAESVMHGTASTPSHATARYELRAIYIASAHIVLRDSVMTQAQCPRASHGHCVHGSAARPVPKVTPRPLRRHRRTRRLVRDRAPYTLRQRMRRASPPSRPTAGTVCRADAVVSLTVTTRATSSRGHRICSQQRARSEVLLATSERKSSVTPRAMATGLDGAEDVRALWGW